jgi:hypothetical protein
VPDQFGDESASGSWIIYVEGLDLVCKIAIETKINMQIVT